MTGEDAPGVAPTTTPDPDLPDVTILHLPDVIHLDTQVWSADIGLNARALEALRTHLASDLVFAESLAAHVARSLFALKVPSPDGSKHYQSGWDDGVEAAMDTARKAVLTALTGSEDGT